MIESAATHASPSGEVQGEIMRALAEAVRSLGYSTEGLDLTLRPIPMEGAWGFGSTLAFQLRRVGGDGTPAELARRVVEALPSLPQIARVEVVNSYINFYVDVNWYSNRIVQQVLARAGEYGCWPRRDERVMVEYANLNTHKAMHIGHLRNVVLGAAVVNILKCAGFEVVSATYLGDIGMHVIRTLWAYMNLYRGQEPPEGRGAWLEKLYVEATARLEYRNNVCELIEEAARTDPAIAAHLTNVLQAVADSSSQDAPIARKLAEALIARDGPDWKAVLAERDYIVLNLWQALGEVLLAQSSIMDWRGSDAAKIQLAEAGEGAGGGGNDGWASGGPEAVAELREDYRLLDSHRDWWDRVPQWQGEIRELFRRWEDKDPELVALWQQTRQWSLDMFERIFRDLGVRFDVWFFESEVEEPGKRVVEELVRLGIADDLRPQGPVIVRIDDKLREHPRLSQKYMKELYRKGKDGTLEPKEAWRVLVVLRSDGTSLYATKDLELARRKFDEWHVDRAIYVVDSRQSLYLQQIFRVLELWGFPQAEKCFHLAYEFVNTPEGAISSRRGGAPLYEDFEREALRRAREVVEAKEAESPRGLTEEQKQAIARAVAYGAMKMGMLDKDNNRVITFRWEEALNPERQSATYVQYSHARATRVVEKAPAELLPSADRWYDFTSPTAYEIRLLEMIARLPEEVARAADNYKPVVIATYCFDLADAFNNFYHNCPILKAPGEEQVRARLALTAAAKQTLANALGLLGIEAPDMM